MIAVNFIPSHRLQAKRRRVCLRRWTVFCIAHALHLIIVVLCARFIMMGGSNTVQAALSQITQEIAESQNAVTATNLKLAEARQTLAANRAVAQHPDWSLLLVLLADTLGDQVVLRNCQIDPKAPKQSAAGEQQTATAPAKPTNEYVLQLSGLGRSQEVVSQFVLRLEQTGLFDRVALVNTVREPFLNGQAFGFSVECKLSRSGGSAP